MKLKLNEIMALKNPMRAILPTCLKPEKAHKILSQTSKSSSYSRLSLLDMRCSCSSFSALEISNSLVGPKLHIFTFEELREITQNFSRSNFLGEGGFGPVYKGFVNDNSKPGLEAQVVAVKLLNSNSSQGHMEWLAEIVFLGQLRHPHLVQLIGYCYEDEHRLLVYKYMPRGNLENRLFKRYCMPLPWQTRMKIAVGVAKGLAFLHKEEKPIIYRDLKPSNILLDNDYNAKLSDFGLATDGPEGDEVHAATRVMGTQGYAAPEYLMTGHLTTMSDVYSFGVVLLELITGKQSIDQNRPTREQNLVKWARPILKDPQKLDSLIDPILEGEYSTKGSRIAAAVAYRCLSRHVKSRPTMSNVVKILEPLLGFDDFPSKTFVYIVPSESEEENEGEEKENRSKGCVLYTSRMLLPRSSKCCVLDTSA